MTAPLAELEAADAARFEAMVKEGARWLEGRGALGPLEEHPAIVYTGEGYRVWLHCVVHSILDGVGVPTLLARLRAAEAVCRRVDETAATCVPSTDRPMTELIAEWKARS